MPALPDSRLLYLLGFLACAGMMGFALYAEYILFLDPCPLCVFQRVAVIVLGLVFLAAAIQDPRGWGRYVYAVLIGLVALGGIGVAAWHVRMQSLPPDEVPTCGPGLDYILENNSFGEALSIVFAGSGSCADVVWQFLGLSMPAWVIICLVVLGGMGLFAALRTPTAAASP
jgi:disulfide bond formation protein DsbB